MIKNIFNKKFLWTILFIVCLVGTLGSQELLFPVGGLMIFAVFFLIMEFLDNKYTAQISMVTAFSVLIYTLIWILLKGTAPDVIIALIILVVYIIVRILMFLGRIPKWPQTDENDF